MSDHDYDPEFEQMARAAGAALRRPAPEDGPMRARGIRKHRHVVRATMVGVGALAIVGAGVYIAQGKSIDDASTPTTTAAPAAAQYPLAFPTAPDGYALAGQSVRPAVNDGAVRGAVFVKRDATNAIVERVLVELTDDAYNGAPGLALPSPANLAPVSASSSRVVGPGMLVAEYGLGDRGRLRLWAYHDDPATYGTVTDAMQAVAAALSITPGQDLGAAGTLPEGWSLVAAGSPERTEPDYFQAFELDRPDGGKPVTVDNRFTDDQGFPYWMAYQTLQPITVRGHMGFITFYNASPMLIWEEVPGQWVTLFATGMTTDEALALADQLAPVATANWGPDGVAVPTTTTTLPTGTTT